MIQEQTSALQPLFNEELRIGTYTARDLAMLKPYIRHNTVLQEIQSELLGVLEEIMKTLKHGKITESLVISLTAKAEAAITKARGQQ